MTARKLISGALIAYVFIGCSASDDESVDSFEARRTEKLMGVAISEFAHKGKIEKLPRFDELAPLRFGISEQAFKGPRIPYWYEKQSTVKATSRAKEEIVAYCGSLKDKIILPDHDFVSDITNRRHPYKTFQGMAYYPSDIIIGKVLNDRVSPFLFFRDVGSHTTRPHAIAVDGDGNVHLVVSDVFTGDGNRLKVYWPIGNPATKKWGEVHLIEHFKGFVWYSTPRCVSTADMVHLVLGNRYHENGKDIFRLVYYPWKKKEKFGKPLIIYEGPHVEFQLASCFESNALLVVYSSKEGVFMLGNQDNAWRGSRLLREEIKDECPIDLVCVEKNTYLLRVASEENRQFQIRLTGQK